MPRFMDFHEDLTLPAEAIAQIAEDTRNGTADDFGVRQIERSGCRVVVTGIRPIMRYGAASTARGGACR